MVTLGRICSGGAALLICPQKYFFLFVVVAALEVKSKQIDSWMCVSLHFKDPTDSLGPHVVQSQTYPRPEATGNARALSGEHDPPSPGPSARSTYDAAKRNWPACSVHFHSASDWSGLHHSPPSSKDKVFPGKCVSEDCTFCTMISEKRASFTPPYWTKGVVYPEDAAAAERIDYKSMQCNTFKEYQAKPSGYVLSSEMGKSQHLVRTVSKF